MICTKPRDLYDMGSRSQHEDDDSYTECMPNNINTTSILDGCTNWARVDIEDQGHDE